MIVEKQMECRLAGETEVLGENLPQLCLLYSDYFLDVLFDPENGGDKCLRKVSELLQDYTASHLRRQ
jgi:hypothetical protein